MKKVIFRLSLILFLSSPLFHLQAKDSNSTGLQNNKNLNRKTMRDSNQTKVMKMGKTRMPAVSEINLLRSLLDSSPERLKIMRKTIERVESMSPDQKKKIKDRLSKLRDLPPQIRIKELGRLRVRHEKLNRYWQSLSPEIRKDEIDTFRKLNLEERDNYHKRINTKL